MNDDAAFWGGEGEQWLSHLIMFLTSRHLLSLSDHSLSLIILFSHLIPGLEPSADPVLQSRLFSYADTHRHRLGPNYLQLPVNQSALDKEMFNFQRDGEFRFSFLDRR